MGRATLVAVVFAFAALLSLIAYKSVERGDATLQASPAIAGGEPPRAPNGSGDPEPSHEPVGSGEIASFSTPLAGQRASRLEEAVDPEKDGWKSEALSDHLLRQLKHLAAAAITPGADLAVDAFASPFACTDLRPPTQAPESLGRLLRVHRQEETPPPVHAGGADAFRAASQGLQRLFGGEPPAESHVKLHRIELDGDRIHGSALFQAEGPAADGHIQVNARWDLTWSSQTRRPRLLSLSVAGYEEKHASGGAWFRDETLAILDPASEAVAQLRQGVNHWLRRLEESHGIHDSGRNGLAIGDVNGDDLPDLYVCQNGGLPNRLFIQQANGTAKETAAEARVNWLDNTTSALLLDLDNDGDSDLVCGTIGAILLMENDGAGSFRLAGSLEVSDQDVKSMASADYDLDGDLDLYVCVDLAAGPATGAKPGFVYHDANDGGANILFENRLADGAAWDFVDVTRASGLSENNRRHSLAAAWEDIDNDGDPDLYVANDYGRNSLYLNTGGKFRDIAEAAGVVDSGSGMSVSWGDYNGDGLRDLYVANMWSSAGGRITNQPGFQSGADEGVKRLYKRFAKGNSLFKNNGDGGFTEVGDQLGVEMGRWAWSSLLADINNDGWDDALIANGYLTTSDTGDL